MRLERAPELDAACVRQALVDERDLRREPRLHVTRGGGRRGSRRADAGGGEDLDRRLAHRVVVVDDEHGSGGDVRPAVDRVQHLAHTVVAAVAEATSPSSCGTGKGLGSTANAFADSASRSWLWLA